MKCIYHRIEIGDKRPKLSSQHAKYNFIYLTQHLILAQYIKYSMEYIFFAPAWWM